MAGFFGSYGSSVQSNAVRGTGYRHTGRRGFIERQHIPVSLAPAATPSYSTGSQAPAAIPFRPVGPPIPDDYRERMIGSAMAHGPFVPARGTPEYATAAQQAQQDYAALPKYRLQNAQRIAGQNAAGLQGDTMMQHYGVLPSRLPHDPSYQQMLADARRRQSTTAAYALGGGPLTGGLPSSSTSIGAYGLSNNAIMANRAQQMGVSPGGAGWVSAGPIPGQPSPEVQQRTNEMMQRLGIATPMQEGFVGPQQPSEVRFGNQGTLAQATQGGGIRLLGQRARQAMEAAGMPTTGLPANFVNGRIGSPGTALRRRQEVADYRNRLSGRGGLTAEQLQENRRQALGRRYGHEFAARERGITPEELADFQRRRAELGLSAQQAGIDTERGRLGIEQKRADSEIALADRMAGLEEEKFRAQTDLANATSEREAAEAQARIGQIEAETSRIQAETKLAPDRFDLEKSQSESAARMAEAQMRLSSAKTEQEARIAEQQILNLQSEAGLNNANAAAVRRESGLPVPGDIPPSLIRQFDENATKRGLSAKDIGRSYMQAKGMSFNDGERRIKELNAIPAAARTDEEEAELRALEAAQPGMWEDLGLRFNGGYDTPLGLKPALPARKPSR